MRRNLLLGVGGVAAVLGVLFLLQGSGLFKGTPMSNNHFWIYAGAVIAIVGAGIVAVGLRTARH